jgi:hypothetical protein
MSRCIYASAVPMPMVLTPTGPGLRHAGSAGAVAGDRVRRSLDCLRLADVQETHGERAGQDLPPDRRHMAVAERASAGEDLASRNALAMLMWRCAASRLASSKYCLIRSRYLLLGRNLATRDRLLGGNNHSADHAITIGPHLQAGHAAARPGVRRDQLSQPAHVGCPQVLNALPGCRWAPLGCRLAPLAARSTPPVPLALSTA